MHDPLPAQPITMPCSVKEASARLGISERGVRKRLEAGTLAGTRVNGIWSVYVPDSVAEHATGPDYRLLPGTGPELDTVFRSMVDALRAEQTAHLAAKDQTIAVLERRVEQAEAEAVALRHRAEELAVQVAELRRPWWRFWK